MRLRSGLVLSEISDAIAQSENLGAGGKQEQVTVTQVTATFFLAGIFFSDSLVNMG